MDPIYYDHHFKIYFKLATKLVLFFFFFSTNYKTLSGRKLGDFLSIDPRFGPQSLKKLDLILNLFCLLSDRIKQTYLGILRHRFNIFSTNNNAPYFDENYKLVQNIMRSIFRNFEFFKFQTFESTIETFIVTKFL